MDLNTTLSVIAIAIALASLVTTLAQFNEDAWRNLRRWGKKTFDAARISFALLSFLNGAVGIYVFWLDKGIPSRNDILGLVIFLTNVGIGVWQFNAIGQAKILEREAGKKLAS